MGSPDVDGWKVAEIAMGFLMSVLGWLGIRSVNRLDALERATAAKQESDKLFAKQLDRIEEKIDQYESRDSQTRHDIRNAVNAVVTKVAVVEERLKFLISKDAP